MTADDSIAVRMRRSQYTSQEIFRSSQSWPSRHLEGLHDRCTDRNQSATGEIDDGIVPAAWLVKPDSGSEAVMIMWPDDATPLRLLDYGDAAPRPAPTTPTVRKRAGIACSTPAGPISRLPRDLHQHPERRRRRLGAGSSGYSEHSCGWGD